MRKKTKNQTYSPLIDWDRTSIYPFPFLASKLSSEGPHMDCLGNVDRRSLWSVVQSDRQVAIGLMELAPSVFTTRFSYPCSHAFDHRVRARTQGFLNYPYRQEAMRIHQGSRTCPGKWIETTAQPGILFHLLPLSSDPESHIPSCTSHCDLGSFRMGPARQRR